MDGKQGKGYENISFGFDIFNPDSSRYAYVGLQSEKRIVVVYDREAGVYDGVGKMALVFSPDGRRTACVVKRGGRWHVVVDDIDGPGYDQSALQPA